MAASTVPVLWLFGPSGVGKTTVGREICTRLGGAGVSCALVDTDMIGLFRPSNADDPEHHRIKARNLAALWSVFDDERVRCLVLAGGLEEPHQVGMYARGIPGAVVTVCHLVLSEPDHRARVAERNGRSVAWVDDLVVEAKDLDDAEFADVRVDTGGLSVAESATAILRAAGGWPGVA